MAVSSCMDPRLLSRGNSSLSGRLDSSLLIPHQARYSQTLTDAETGGRINPATKPCKIPAPIDQFFRGSELGKWMLTLDGGALVAILGFHPNALLPGSYLPAIIILLLVGLVALFTALLFQEASPAFAVVAVLVGSACVSATFLTMVDAILADHLRPVVWVFVAVLLFILVLLLSVVVIKGIRETYGN